MIYVHEYFIGTGNSRKRVRTVHDSEDDAVLQSMLLGGSVSGYFDEIEVEHANERVEEKVSDIIDNLTGHQFEQGSRTLDIMKVETMNELRKVFI